jgi:hypothetical protein
MKSKRKTQRPAPQPAATKLERILRMTKDFPDGARRLVEVAVMAQRISDMLAERQYAASASVQFEETTGCARELGFMLRDLVWVELFPEDHLPKGKVTP